MASSSTTACIASAGAFSTMTDNVGTATSRTPVTIASVLASVMPTRSPVNDPGPAETYSSSNSPGCQP